MDKLMLTPEEAAEALGVGRSTLYDLMRLQEIPSVKIGRSRRIPVSALLDFADRLATAAAAR